MYAYMCMHACICRKRQKLSESKVSWLAEFHLNLGKTFVSFVSKVLTLDTQ